MLEPLLFRTPDSAVVFEATGPRGEGMGGAYGERPECCRRGSGRGPSSGAACAVETFARPLLDLRPSREATRELGRKASRNDCAEA